MVIAARPTTYKGIQMRSRLEARYAAFLDEEGFDWFYEPRAFAGDRGQYLPDFEVRGKHHVYVEVRPTLERGLLALPLMEVILESEPTARLAVDIHPLGVLWISLPWDRTWRVNRWDQA